MALSATAAFWLLLLNIQDWRRERWARGIASILTPSDIGAIGAFCERAAKPPFRRHFYKGDSIPREFSVLRPVNVDIYGASADACLYRVGDAYAYLRINTWNTGQDFSLFYDFDGNQVSSVVWTKNIDEMHRANPGNRIVTASRMNGREFRREWIVVQNMLLVVDRSYVAGAGDALVAKVALTDRDMKKIEGIIKSIPPEIRGATFRDPLIMDGFWCDIRFTPGGEPGHDYIGLVNAWRDEVDPLLDFFNQHLPEAFQFGNLQEIRGDIRPRKVEVTRFGEHSRSDRSSLPKRHWWILWKRLFGV